MEGAKRWDKFQNVRLGSERNHSLMNIDLDHVAEITKTSRSLTDLADAIAQFKENYQLFAKKNSQFISIDQDLQESFQNAQRGDNIQLAAKNFSECIWGALRAVEKKQKSTEGKWTTKLGNILTRLYPVASLSLGLAAGIGDVISAPEYHADLRRLLPLRRSKAWQRDLALYCR